MFASSRCGQHEANNDTPLILDSIQLPSKMLLHSKSYVSNLYIKRDLPIREIARQLNVRKLVEGWRQVLSMLMPFNAGEKEFFDLLLDKGEIDPTLLADETTLQDYIRMQPLLEWKAINVRQYKGLT